MYGVKLANEFFFIFFLCNIFTCQDEMIMRVRMTFKLTINPYSRKPFLLVFKQLCTYLQ